MKILLRSYVWDKVGGLNLRVDVIKRYCELIQKKIYIYEKITTACECGCNGRKSHYIFNQNYNRNHDEQILEKYIGEKVDGNILKHKDYKKFDDSLIERNDLNLIQALEDCGKLDGYNIVEIPDDIGWEIVVEMVDHNTYPGECSIDYLEYVVEKHRVWGK